MANSRLVLVCSLQGVVQRIQGLAMHMHRWRDLPDERSSRRPSNHRGGVLVLKCMHWPVRDGKMSTGGLFCGIACHLISRYGGVRLMPSLREMILRPGVARPWSFTICPSQLSREEWDQIVVVQPCRYCDRCRTLYELAVDGVGPEVYGLRPQRILRPFDIQYINCILLPFHGGRENGSCILVLTVTF